MDAKGVQLRGVRISGYLDLEAATLRCPLLLKSCYLDSEEPACLDHATASRIGLTGCQLAGLTGKMLTARELDLKRSTFTGPLSLPRVDVGRLSCRGARLGGTGRDGYALDAGGMKVGGNVYLDKAFTTAGAIRLGGADIGGDLRCGGAHLDGRDNDCNALNAGGMKVGGSVYLDDGFTTAGAIRLGGTDIGSNLRCGGAHLDGRDNDCNALDARRIKRLAGVCTSTAGSPLWEPYRSHRRTWEGRLCWPRPP